LAHRVVKRLYALTNRRDATKQIAKRYRREEATRSDPFDASDTKPSQEEIPFELHHHISASRNHPISLANFVLENPGDPAKKVYPVIPSAWQPTDSLVQGFLRKLKGHFLNRLLGRDFDDNDPRAFSEVELNTVRITNNQIYSIQTLSVNYTTYDIRRDRDTINPANHNFVMVRSSELGSDVHPYWYAQVLGVYHAFVFTTHHAARYQSTQHMEFLWVRWLGIEPRYRSGQKYARLPMVGFVEETDDLAFGFLDPSLVIRGCHLIPRFVSGRTNDLMSYQGPTAARATGCTNDWTNFYVNMYVTSFSRLPRLN
jgi:hypothetical protein